MIRFRFVAYPLTKSNVSAGAVPLLYEGIVKALLLSPASTARTVLYLDSSLGFDCTASPTLQQSLLATAVRILCSAQGTKYDITAEVAPFRFAFRRVLPESCTRGTHLREQHQIVYGSVIKLRVLKAASL